MQRLSSENLVEMRSSSKLSGSNSQASLVKAESKLLSMEQTLEDPAESLESISQLSEGEKPYITFEDFVTQKANDKWKQSTKNYEWNQLVFDKAQEVIKGLERWIILGLKKMTKDGADDQWGMFSIK